MYEYSDDFDLVDEPTQILPWAAVEFTWVGAPLYKLASVPISVPGGSDVGKATDKRVKAATRPTGCPPQRIRQIYTDSTPVFCTQLQLRLPRPTGDDARLETAPMDMPVTILSYHGCWTPFDPM